MTVPMTLLGLLERAPSHGYDLKRDYDAFFGRGKPLPFGQVYSTLARLARDQAHRVAYVGGPCVGEIDHDWPIACSIAAKMFG